MDLVAVERGSLPTGGAAERNDAEVDDDTEEATRMNDPGRVDLAQRDREHLIAELTIAYQDGDTLETDGPGVLVATERGRRSTAGSGNRSDRWGVGDEAVCALGS